MVEADKEIIQRILSGEAKAYRLLVERHKDRALTLAVRMLKNKEEAEEVLQDAFVRAFRALPRFEFRSSFQTWFYRVVYNTCVTRLTRASPETVSSIHQGGERMDLEPAATEMPPDKMFESQEIQSIVGEEIQKLSATYAAVVTLFFVQEMSYQEICDATGLPLATVKVRLLRGRAHLQEALVKRLELKSSLVTPTIMKEKAV